MLYNENLREEEQHLIQQIAEQTERGKIDWELTEYNPLSFLNEDKIDKNPAVICQSFSFEAIIGGSRYELDVMEEYRHRRPRYGSLCHKAAAAHGIPPSWGRYNR